MTPHRAVLGLVLIAIALAIASEARAQHPMPRVRERPEAIDAAFRFFEDGRWPEAIEAFELAVREAPGPLSAEALRRWGVAASEAGRPLAAHVRLGQYLASKPVGAEREAAIERIGRARETLLLDAARFSRLVITAERRSEPDSVPERYLVRVAARDGDVSLEGLSSPSVKSPLSVNSPTWRRAEEIPAAPYLDLLRRMLEALILVDAPSLPAVDSTEPAPRSAVVVRLVIGEEERRLEAVRGESYDRLKEVADRVLEFARTVPRLPEFEAKAAPAPAPPKPGKKRR
jgi:tetratricopeptide (TPR) repeat protein